MYIYQNGKLYLEQSENLIGVNIDANGVHQIKGTETKSIKTAIRLTPYEVKAKFHLFEGETYIFPQVIKKVEKVEQEVVKNDTTRHNESSARKRSRK